MSAVIHDMCTTFGLFVFFPIFSLGYSSAPE